MSNDLKGLVLGDYRFRVRHAPGILGWASVTVGAPPPPPPPPPPVTPTVALTAPTDGGTSTAIPVTVTATATANAPATSIANVQFRANGVTFATDSSGPPWSVDWNPSNGTYSLDAVATDNLGGIGTSTARTHTVTVSPPAGTELTRFGYANESTTDSLPADTPSRMFGQLFEEGDIPTGDWPQCQLVDGTPVAMDVRSPVYYDDGSLQFASLTVRPPSGVAALSRTFTVSGTTITAANHTGLTTGDPVLLATDEKLHRPFDPWVIYYVRLGTGTTVTLHTSAAAAIAGTGAVLPSTVAAELGAGTFWIQPCLPLVIKNGGSAPTAGSLTLSAVVAAMDLNVQAVGIADELGNTYTSTLAQGVTDGGLNVLAIDSGPVSSVWRVYQEFNNGTVDHDHLGVRWYIQALQTPGGGLHGIRVLPECRNGWADVTTTQTKSHGFTSLKLRNNTTDLVSMGSVEADRSFTAVGGSATLTCSSAFTSLVNTTEGGYYPVPTRPVMLSNSGGALPTGLSATTGYWMRTTVGVATVSLHPTHNDAANNTNAIVPSDAGSGAHSIIFKPWIQHYSSGPAIAGVDGEYTYVQGTGGARAAETTGRIVQNVRDMLRTKNLPPYRLDRVHQLGKQYIRDYRYDALWHAPATGQSGPNPTMGAIDSYSVGFMLRQNSRRTIRAQGLVMHGTYLAMLRKSTHNIVNLSEVAQTNMGTSTPTASFGGSFSPDQWLVMPKQVNSQSVFAGAWEWSHRIAFNPFPHIWFAEPQFYDRSLEIANAALGWVYGDGYLNYRYRTQRVPAGGSTGPVYRNTVMSDISVRTGAWRSRDMAYAALLMPSTWNGAPVKSYLKTLLNSDLTWTEAVKAAGSTFYKSIKAPPWDTNSDLQSCWQHGFAIAARLLLWQATRDANAKRDVEERIAFFDFIRQNFGLSYATTFTLQTPNYYAAASWDELFVSGTVGPCYFRASTDEVHSVMTVTLGNAAGFTVGGTITNVTTGATAEVLAVAVGTLSLIAVNGTFASGNLITGAGVADNRALTSVTDGINESRYGTMANNQPMMLSSHQGGVVPGLPSLTPLYIRDLNASRRVWKVSLTPGGAVLDITTNTYLSNASNQVGGFRTAGSDEMTINLTDSTDISQALQGYVRWAQAWGFTIPAGFKAALEASADADNVNFTGNTAYMFTDDMAVY